MQIRQIRQSTLLIAAMGALSYGCGLIESVQSDKILAATLVAVPPLDFKQLLAGNPGLGGATPPTVPGQVMAQVFFAVRNIGDLQKSAGIVGATVTLSYSGKSFNLPDVGGGYYALTSVTRPDLTYEENVECRVEVGYGGKTFTATVTSPAQEKIAEFHPVTLIPVTTGGSLTLRRASTENLAFTSVVSAADVNDLASPTLQPTYTDVPTSAADLLDLFTNDSRWRKQTITIPEISNGKKSFPNPNSLYVISVSAAKRGTTSDNLFMASGFLVGIADLGLGKTP